MLDEYDEDYAFNKALEDCEEIDENANLGNEAVRFMCDPKTQILTKDNAESLVGHTIRWSHPEHYENAPRMYEGKIIEIKKDRIVMEAKSENDGNPFRHEWIFLNYEGIFCCSDEDRYVHFQVKFDRVQDRAAFEEELTDFLSDFILESDFISEMELYLSEAVLAIHSRSLELRIGVPEEFSRAWKLYNLAQLFRDEDGETVPDCDVVSDIAASFFFIR